MVICNISGDRSFHWYLAYQILTNPDRITDVMLFQKIKSLNGGYLDNTKHLLLIFWLCHIKKLNFRHFNTNSKKFTVTVVFFSERNKTAPEKPILFCLVFQGVFGYLSEAKTTEGVGRLSKMSKDNKTFTRRNLIISQEHVRITNVLFIYLFIYFSRTTLQTLAVVSTETAIIKKLANLIANSWATNTKH